MIYYKVKPEYDQKRTKNDFLIADELYTKTERAKMPEVPDSAFICVNIPEKRTYKCFGARFAANFVIGGK